MNITIPKQDEFDHLVKKYVRRDWRPIYVALAEHGHVILDEEPEGIRTAFANHYRGEKNRARIIKMEDSRCLIFLEPRNGQTS